jgi:hypothetical protein
MAQTAIIAPTIDAILGNNGTITKVLQTDGDVGVGAVEATAKYANCKDNVVLLGALQLPRENKYWACYGRVPQLFE